MYAFYVSLEKPAGSHTQNIFIICRSHNRGNKLDGNVLANVQRDIASKKKLTDFELTKLKETDVKDIDSWDVGIRDRDVDDSDEGADGVSCTDADTREAMTRNNDQRENVNHIRAIDDIPIDEGSEDEFELVGECNYMWVCDTTSNNTIMYHLSVNENSKINSSTQKSRIDRIGKENNDVEYTSFRNKIIKTSEKNEAISMSEPADLTKVKIKKSQENDLNFANLAIQEFCDDIEIDMNGVNTMLYVHQNRWI